MTEIVISQERADTEGIVKSAQRLLEKYGYRRMTMDDLAREVGMSKGALYLRFATKEDVAVACIER
ncbi:TetR family transcriptional regulator, partial [Vibrio parahaemolyticus]